MIRNWLFILIAAIFYAHPRADVPLHFYVHQANEIQVNATNLAVWFVLAKGETGNLVEATGAGPNRFTLSLGGWACDPVAIVASRNLVNGRFSSIRPVLLDSLSYSSNLTIPGAVTGFLKENQPVLFPMDLKPKEQIAIEGVANRLGSSADPVLRILDEKGREIISCDDSPQTLRDPFLILKAPQKGRYFVELRDRANSGGPNFNYILRAVPVKSNASFAPAAEYLLTPALIGSYLCGPHGHAQFIMAEREPNDIKSKANMFLGSPWFHEGGFGKKDDRDWFTLPVNESDHFVLSVETRSLGSSCDAALRLMDPTGKLISESVGSGPDGPSITNKFKTKGLYNFEVREISKRFGPDCRYWLRLQKARPGVELATEIERTAFSKEGEAKIKLACKRYDYDGPVTLRVDGAPDGVEIIDAVIPEKKNEVELKLKRTKEVEAFQIRIFGVIPSESEDKKASELMVSTMPALKKLFPLQMFPCAAMDGWIAINPPP